MGRSSTKPPHRRYSEQPVDRDGRRLLRRRHPADVGRHRQADRRDRAGDRLELAGRGAVPESRIQDVMVRRCCCSRWWCRVLGSTLRSTAGIPRVPVRLSHSASTGVPVQHSPATVVGDITVPTLFLQGTVDTCSHCSRRSTTPRRSRLVRGRAGQDDLVLRRPRAVPRPRRQTKQDARFLAERR